MPLFSRFKNKGAQATSKNHVVGNGQPAPASQPKWQTRWESTVIVPSEVRELVRVCTAEMKSRAEALDAPFLLLPFRPDSDPQGARTFISNFYKSNAEGSSQYTSDGLKQELRLTDSVVLCSILKWCWSRMPEGVVSWPVYEGFRIGEQESKLARNAFDTFIPIGSDSEARRSIIFDFFDLLAAVAAHGKMNGLTGRKVSRLAGWWAFHHSDDGKGFEGGYKSWTSAADAASHLFFAYLRSLSPETDPSMNVIERIPRSLQALVASTEYPPETPSLLQRTTPKVVMLVDSVSPTPFALLRRAKHFEYRDRDEVLREYSEYEDPVDALTEECKRVLYAVSAANQSSAARSRHGLRKPEESWTAFQSLGFGDIDEKALAQKPPASMHGSTKTVGHGPRELPQSRSDDHGRPTTPSWADFLSSGFADDGSAKSPTLLYPPAHVLPPLRSRASSPGPLSSEDEKLPPGELAAITNLDLDDAFWWVWMTSLAGEEPAARKAVFGRCTLIETSILGGRWLIMEEQVKGASPDPAEGVYVAPKKSLFSFTKRGRLGRKRSTPKVQSPDQPQRLLSATPSKTSITSDQQAKIKAAARALTTKQETLERDNSKRGRHDDSQPTKTNSMLTLGLQSEAGPAMKWASSYDKNAVRAQYLGDATAGKGVSREDLRKTSSANINGDYSTNTQDAKQSPAVANETSSKMRQDAPAVPGKEPGAPPSGPPAVAAVSKRVDAPTAYDRHPDPDESPAAPELFADFDKEIAVESALSPKILVGRKPVQRAGEHPALRTQSNESPKTVESSPPQNAAAVAAAVAARRAMQPAPATHQDSNSQKKTGAGNAGIRKLFGKKKDGSGRGDSFDLPRPETNGHAPSVENGTNRRLSLIRKKPVSAPASKSSPPTAMASSEAEAQTHEPTVNAAQFQHEYPTAQRSRSSTREDEAAEREFSRFDQGPLESMPAAVPLSEDNSPQPDHGHFESIAVPLSHSYPVKESSMTFDDHASDIASEITTEDHNEAAIVQDRWATIRESAQKRVAARQNEHPGEDQSVQSKASQSLRTDDGETSGEETIESRVARIKARVAELTGNMDNAARA